MIKNYHLPRFNRLVKNLARFGGEWRRFLPLGMAFGVPQLLRGQNHVDYRFESYNEDSSRMMILTHSLRVEQKLTDNVTAKASLTYDGVSGATPIGTHDGKGHAVIKPIDSDIREAVEVELETKLGRNTLTPSFAYSKEHDYESYGMALNDAMEFNDKNTIIQYGLAEDLDSVRHRDKKTWTPKFSTEGIIGVSQLLSPKTVVSAAFTFGYDSGYLTDPYRYAEYEPSFLPFSIATPENRPGYRTKEILLLTATHYFEQVNGSLEGSYRFHHDSYGIYSQTAGLEWHQWVGKHLILEPFARAYYQSSASFYSTLFLDPLPSYLSSDYRLSEFYSTDFGLEATVVINDHVHITAGYHRYEMHGLDKTTQDMYPQANVYSIGCSILW